MAKVWLMVRLEAPEGATRAAVREYVHDAVAAWKGSLKPISAMTGDDDWYDPMSDLDPVTVRVTLQRRPGRSGRPGRPGRPGRSLGTGSGVLADLKDGRGRQ